MTVEEKLLKNAADAIKDKNLRILFNCRDEQYDKLLIQHKMFYNAEGLSSADIKQRLLINIYTVILLDCIKILKENGINYILIKGLPLSSLLFENSFIRQLGDIDIVVQEESFKTAYSLLTTNGYAPNTQWITNDNVPILWGPYFHEIQLFKSVYGFPVSVELKKGSSATFNPFRQNWWSNLSCINISGEKITSLNREYEILHLFMNSYNNNCSQDVYLNNYLRDFFEIAWLINNCKNIDWEKIIFIANVNQALHTIYYVIKNTSSIFNIPKEHMDLFLQKTNPTEWGYLPELRHFAVDIRNNSNNDAHNRIPFKGELTTYIFNKDMAFLEYIKHYKSMIYSENNKYYTDRLQLSDNKRTDWIEYVGNGNEINMSYRYRRTKFLFIIDLIIKNIDDRIAETGSAEIWWLDNNINSPAYYYVISSPVRKNYKRKRVTSISAEVQFETEEFKNRIQNIEQELGNVYVETIKSGNYISIHFYINEKTILQRIRTVEISVKLVLRLSTDYIYSLGSKPDVIEFIDS